MRIRPLNGREVGKGEVEAVKVSSDDPHALQAGAWKQHCAVLSYHLRQPPIGGSSIIADMGLLCSSYCECM